MIKSVVQKDLIILLIKSGILCLCQVAGQVDGPQDQDASPEGRTVEEEVLARASPIARKQEHKNFSGF